MPPRKSSKAAPTQPTAAAAPQPKPTTSPKPPVAVKSASTKKKANGSVAVEATAGPVKTPVVETAAVETVAVKPAAAKANAATRKKSQLAPEKISPDRSVIEFRAWEIWVSEGCPHGRELEHWLQAEQEVLSVIGH